MLRSVDATVPPAIATRNFVPSLSVISASEQALIAVAQADMVAADHLTALGRFLIRTESVASSKIERITASPEDFAKAIAGQRSNSSAVSMVAASTALQQLVTSAGEKNRIGLDDLLSAHAALMEDDPTEARHAGRLRDMQNWIGGSDHSPRDALHVPPTPQRVPQLMEDLLLYLNRDDLPSLVQAAIAHAQFESIHPFTDGNGRIGRALVSASLRRRGVTRHAVIPIASGTLARRDDYFDALGEYRKGHPEPVIALFAHSAEVAARESRESIQRITALPDEWASQVKPRKGSTAAALLPIFYDHAVLTADEIERLTGGNTAAMYTAIAKLENAEVIREITGRKRDRVWVAGDLLAELDDLDRRIQAAMR